MSKVVKIIAVVDDETADRLVALSGLSTKEREKSDLDIIGIEQGGDLQKMYFVHAEVV